MSRRFVGDRSFAVLVAVVAALLGGSVLGGSDALARAGGCSPSHAHTVLSSRTVRVYTVGGRFYGCLRSIGRPLLLAHFGANRATHSREVAFARRVLTGTWVAWTDVTTKRSGTTSVIAERDLRSGRARHVSFGQSAALPDALALSTRGVLAWLAPDASPSYPAGTRPGSIAIAQLGDDAQPDAAVLAQDGVWALRGGADGSFSTSSRVATVAANGPLGVADVNGDGASDLLVPTKSGVTVRPGLASGAFGAATTIALRGGAGFVATGDLDSDGVPDLVAGAPGARSVWVILSHGDATFAAPVRAELPETLTALTVGDVDGDGAGDVVVPESSGRIALLLGAGDGTLHPPVELSDTKPASAVSLADLDADGTPDLVLAQLDGGVGVMHGRGGGAFSAPVTYASGTSVSSIAIDDVTVDGVPDLVAGDSGSGGVVVLDGRGDATFTNAHSYRANRGAHAVALADVTGDGALDVVVANSDSGDVSLLANRGNGTFTSTKPAEDLAVLGSGRGHHELVHAAPIARRSLRFRGTRLVWTAGGHPASARPR
jgi:hypothetical protein